MGLFNIQTLSLEGNELSAKRLDDSTHGGDVPILQWVPAEENVPVSVVLPDATKTAGFAETGLRREPVGSVVQFVRSGFCRVDNVGSESVTLYFAHN